MYINIAFIISLDISRNIIYSKSSKFKIFLIFIFLKNLFLEIIKNKKNNLKIKYKKFENNLKIKSLKK